MASGFLMRHAGIQTATGPGKILPALLMETIAHVAHWAQSACRTTSASSQDLTYMSATRVLIEAGKIGIA